MALMATASTGRCVAIQQVSSAGHASTAIADQIVAATDHFADA